MLFILFSNVNIYFRVFVLDIEEYNQHFQIPLFGGMEFFQMTARYFWYWCPSLEHTELSWLRDIKAKDNYSELSF